MIIVGYIWVWLTLTQLVIPCCCLECLSAVSLCLMSAAPGSPGSGSHRHELSWPRHIVKTQSNVFSQIMLKGLGTSIGPEVFMWPSQVDVPAKYLKYPMALVTEGRGELTFRHHQMNLIKIFLHLKSRYWLSDQLKCIWIPQSFYVKR